MTKSPEKVEKLFAEVPKSMKIIGRQLTKEYRVNWQKEGTEDFVGSRFVFTLEDLGSSSTGADLREEAFAPVPKIQVPPA